MEAVVYCCSTISISNQVDVVARLSDAHLMFDHDKTQRSDTRACAHTHTDTILFFISGVS